MGLQRGLGDVKDELQMFIDSQKRKIDNERRELNKAKAVYSPRDDKLAGSDQNGRVTRDGLSKQSQKGMDVGGDHAAFERRQKELREEQRRDYKRYAAEKEFRRTGKMDSGLIDDVTPHANSRNEKLSVPFKRSEVTTPDIIDAYADLLRKKRAEEKIYREMYDDPDMEIDRKVRFEESETTRTRKDAHIEEEDPFQWARDKAKIGHRQKSAGEIRSEKQSEFDQDTRSKSVPPTTAAGVFGGSENPDASKRRKEQYKRELELQIKEKEDQKLREKMKRLGRISSSDNLVERNKVEDSPRSKGHASERDNDDRPESQQRSGNKAQSRSQRRQIDDENDFNDRQFTSRNRPRGDLPYRGIPGYDPYMQMMQGRFDMRMDPYYMQNAMYGGASGYNNAMYGQNMPMFGQNAAMFGPGAAMMPRMDANGEFRRGSDLDRASRLDRQRTPRTPRSPKKENSPRQTENAKAQSKKSPRGKAAVAGVFGDSDLVDKEAERAAKLAYQEELKQQMKERQAAKEREKKERERYNAKIEAEIETYNPWGKSGGGAPVKDKTGNLIADLKAMHKVNEAGIIISPRAHENDAALSAAMSSLPKDSPVLAALTEFQNAASSALPASTNDENVSEMPTGRGAALLELKGESKNPAQKKEQLTYQSFLKQQIEEKQRKKLEEEQRQKEEERRETQRLEEQRIKMEQEFLLEQERERQKEEEIRAKNDEMRKIAEQKRQEVERQRKEMEEDRIRTIQKRSSELPQQNIETRRQASPPIPTLQKKAEVDHTSSSVVQNYAEQNTQVHYQRPKSRPIPTVAKQQKTEVTMESHGTQVSNPPSQRGFRSGSSQRHARETTAEETVDEDVKYLNNIRNQLFQVSQENDGGFSSTNNGIASQQRVIKQLAALRRQLSVEERKVQTELEKNVGRYQESKKLTNTRRNEDGKVEIFERARIRRGSAQRKLAPKVYEQRHADPKHVDEFTNLTDTSSIMDFKVKYPNKPITSSELDLQQKEFIRLQEQKLQALRQAISDTSDQLMLNISNERPDAGKQRPASKQSILESDSKFISMEDDPSIRINSRVSTAKSVRRPLDTDSLIEDNLLQKPRTPGGYSVNSLTSQAIDDMAARNEARLKKLRGEAGRDVDTPNDPNDIIHGFMNENSSSGRRPKTNQSEKSLPAASLRK